MDEDTNRVRPKSPAPAALDAVDRKLLGLLVEDATRSYAELGRALHLSPPAVHERVKRLKRDRVITRVAACLDGSRIGRPLTVFVHVDASGWGKSPEMLALAELPEVEEIHAVTGDTCVLLKVRTGDTHGLEDLLARIYAIPGVKGTRSHVVLRSYLERGPLPLA
jgi:DNA-binding Lrp family transcriptional regulator